MASLSDIAAQRESFFATLSEVLPLDALEKTIAIDMTITAQRLLNALEVSASEGEQDTKSGFFRSLPLPTLSVREGEFFSDDGEIPEGKQPDLLFQTRIGKGGMGRVHSAQQCALRRQVAVKMLKSSVLTAKERQMLLREALLMGQLEHPNIVPVYTLGQTHQDEPLLVMKRISGVPWRDLMRKKSHPFWKKLPPQEDRLAFHLDVFLNVCNAVSYAHNQGVIHRDIKPENVMVGKFGEVYLLDWGIAVWRGKPEVFSDIEDFNALLPKHTILGTPAYMAPEMTFAGEELVDERTDVYLLGATLFEVVTGRLRHQEKTLAGTLFAARQSLPYDFPENVPGELAQIINKATAAEPGKRYETAQAMRDAVVRFLQHRAGVRLSTSANIHLHVLQGLVEEELAAIAKGKREHFASPDSEGESRIEQTQRCFTSAHVGFLHALREWPENRVAQDGLQTCLELFIKYALARRDIQTAAQWISQLPRASEKLSLEFESLRKAKKDEHEKIQELQVLRQELDMRRANVFRTGFFSIVGVLIVVAFVLILRFLPSSKSLHHIHLVMLPCGVLAIYGVALYIWRDALLQRIIDRRLMFYVVVVFLGVLGNRLMGAFFHTPIHHIFAQDLLIEAICCGLGALTVHFRFFSASLLFLFGGVLALFNPDLARWSFGAMNALVIFLFVSLFRSLREESQKSSSSSL